MTQFLVSLVVTFIAAPGVRWLMLHRGIIDVPNHRSSHLIPTPRGGGLACLLGVIGASVATAGTGQNVPWAALLAVMALALVGFADDRFDLSPLVRIALQVAAGVLIGWSLGGLWLVLVGGILSPVVVNVVNFMDGINGITGLSVSVWGATAWVVGLTMRIPDVWLIGAVALGAALGFLPWNLPTAKLFLGDAGSYLFGGLVVAGLMTGLAAGASLVVLAAPLALYLADTGTVLLRRARRGERLMTAHRGHTYQRLAEARGLTHPRVALLVATSAAVISLAWTSMNIVAACSLTAAILALYLATPSIMTRWRLLDEAGR